MMLRWTGRAARLRPALARHAHGRIFSAAERTAFERDGFIAREGVLHPDEASALAEHFEPLFAGDFPTGVYPDEWHWRKGISHGHAFREIVNAWKSSPAVARVALSPELGAAAAELMGWACGTRLAQDDLLWKPPGASGVAYHRDATYIREQFVPSAAASLTVWIALDDVDETTGTVEYAPGSHRWPVPATARVADSSFHGEGDDLAAPMRAAADAAGVRDAPQTVAVALRRGGAVFHHDAVWHGSQPNAHATRPRRALGVHLLRRDVAFRATPPPDYIYGRYALGRAPHEAFFPTVWRPPPGDDTRTAQGDGVGRPCAGADFARRLRACGLVGEAARAAPVAAGAFVVPPRSGGAVDGVLERWRASSQL